MDFYALGGLAHGLSRELVGFHVEGQSVLFGDTGFVAMLLL
jgi:hypothetical protein